MIYLASLYHHRRKMSRVFEILSYLCGDFEPTAEPQAANLSTSWQVRVDSINKGAMAPNCNWRLKTGVFFLCRVVEWIYRYIFIHVYAAILLYNKHAEEVHTGSWDWREAISRMSWGLDFSTISLVCLFGRLVSFLKKSQRCIIPRFAGEKHGHCPNSHDLIFVSRMVKLRRLVSQTQYLINTVHIYISLYIYIFSFEHVFSPKSIMTFPHLFWRVSTFTSLGTEPQRPRFHGSRSQWWHCHCPGHG